MPWSECNAVRAPVAALMSPHRQQLTDFRNAAALYRLARSNGKTIRPTLDCLIATVCIREDSATLHNDRDFDHLADVTDLRRHPAEDSGGFHDVADPTGIAS